MIRMIQSSSAAHAKSYFSQALQKADYYIDDQELKGRFHGRLVDRLGLKPEASKEAFFNLCENINPATGQPLTPRTKEERTVGYDINFHCPKSVSIIHMLSNDNHILDAFQQSVHETMAHIEQDAMTRVRTDGRYEDRKTGELLYAEFTHQTARPTEGHTPDVHLHSHCFTFNTTWDEVEKRYKACQFRDINRDMPYYQQRFHKTLSDKLIDLGYDIRLTDKSFEIAGVPKGVIDLFSKRTDEIGQIAKEQNITDPKQLSELGARTRSRKDQGLSMAELKADWKRQIREYSSMEGSEQGGAIRYAPKKVRSSITAKNCVDHAVHHSFERASVMGDRRILASAYRYSIGHRHISMDETTTAFQNDDRIIHVKEKYRTLCTTKSVLKEEKRMVDLALEGQGKFKPLYSTLPKIEIDGQQGDAIAHLLSSKDRVNLVRGVAGAGKTTMLKELTRHLQHGTGKAPVMSAPTANASRNVLAEEGFKEAETTARLIVDDKLKKAIKDNYWIIDESGLLGNKDTISILSIAKEKNARVIFVGDTRQHSSVTRGDALRILSTVAGIRTAEMNKIHRQQNAVHRAAVEDLSNGDVKEAFSKLDSIGSIKTTDPLKPNQDLVDDYIKSVKNGNSVLIVSPTHKQGNAVTADIRQRLRSSGMIGKKELTVKKLVNANYTEAEKADSRSYKIGHIIQFDQNAPRLKRGSSWTVSLADGKDVIISDNKGNSEFLPLTMQSRFSVYHRSELGLSKGDKVRITKNGFDEHNKRLDNGTSLEVAKVSKSGKAVLINPASKSKYEITDDFGHIDHDYCTTSHTSQGRTVSEVYISQPASTFSATNAKQFYVSVSRSRQLVRIYTDDKEALLESAAQIGDRKSAIELVGDYERHKEHIPHAERDYSDFKEQNKEKEIEDYRKLDHTKDYEP